LKPQTKILKENKRGFNHTGDNNYLYERKLFAIVFILVSVKKYVKKPDKGGGKKWKEFSQRGREIGCPKDREKKPAYKTKQIYVFALQQEFYR